jgi:hypothetical protein
MMFSYFCVITIIENQHPFIMRYLSIFSIFFLFVLSTTVAQPLSATKYRWTRISSEYGELDRPNKGKFQTDCVIADILKNGKDEFVIFEKTETPSVVMYVHKEGRQWEQWVIERRKVSTGESAAAYDIDGDGDLDIICGSEETNQIWWWENPYPNINSDRGWKRNTIKKSGAALHKDMVIGDFDGDGVIEIAFWNQGENALYIAKKPANLSKSDEWPLSKIYTYQAESQMFQRTEGTELKTIPINFHQGIAKADINLDGVEDIIAGGMYFTYKEGQYIHHDIDRSFNASKIAAGQLVPGGRPEVLMSPAQGTGPLMAYHFVDGTWVPTILEKNLRRAHSLQIIDFDKDGLPDIFVTEMKTKDVKDPKIFILLNKGNLNFERLDVSAGFGSHNSGIGDFDGDGDLDILIKPYAADTPRLDMWINEGKR